MRLGTPLKCKIFENIMKNGTFAPEESIFHIIFKTIEMYKKKNGKYLKI